ncbi:MAG TPA: alkaline phosphatase family protein [Planctomycetota bacterium]|nr:alkaline phosphatase family protein [Planctomycetota bacterium]HRR79547.1 alkaline phosphatase family protein [Planctomycetota bacterium]HRT96063.1 alkaline phosphatase family protein [Planctomycetota bacterium]
MPRRLLIIQVAGLGYDFLVRHHGGEAWEGLRFRPAASVFPALTCPVQASFRTAAPPGQHGMVFNGAWSRELRRPLFWEQSSALVQGPRIWEGTSPFAVLPSGGLQASSAETEDRLKAGLQAKKKSVGLLFWQQSLGEGVDVLLSPAPIHKHHGGMIEDVYSRPPGLYAELIRRVGRAFKLMSYWGPLASGRSSQWIAAATGAVMGLADVAPDLLLTYLPHLDYALLRHGPSSGQAARAFAETMALLSFLRQRAEQEGYEFLVFGDYAFADVSRPVFPNRLLRERGLMAARNVRGRLYPDLHASRAFAVVDHEVAHVYVRDQAEVPHVARVFEEMNGVDQVWTGQAIAEAGIAHPNSGEVVLVAEEGAWFAYPWWTARREQPDYATHVDIHSKPGFDPCELFFGWPPPFAVSTDAARVRGSHGRVGRGREVAWAASFDLGPAPSDLIGLAKAVQYAIRET